MFDVATTSEAVMHSDPLVLVAALSGLVLGALIVLTTMYVVYRLSGE